MYDSVVKKKFEDLKDNTISSTRESVRVLQECIDLQNAKGRDYQNSHSSVRQADYYLNGVDTIYDIMHAKMLRIRSLQSAAKVGEDANYESIEDSVKDLINYCSFYVAWCRRSVDGQSLEHDMFNRPLPVETNYESR